MTSTLLIWAWSLRPVPLSLFFSSRTRSKVALTSLAVKGVPS